MKKSILFMLLLTALNSLALGAVNIKDPNVDTPVGGVKTATRYLKDASCKCSPPEDAGIDDKTNPDEQSSTPPPPAPQNQDSKSQR